MVKIFKKQFNREQTEEIRTDSFWWNERENCGIFGTNVAHTVIYVDVGISFGCKRRRYELDRLTFRIDNLCA